MQLETIRNMIYKSRGWKFSRPGTRVTWYNRSKSNSILRGLIRLCEVKYR